MLALDNTGIQSVNSPQVKTFFLYEIQAWARYSNSYVFLRYTNWDKPISYEGNVYTPNVIKHSDITQGTDGKVNDMTVSIGNADRVIQDYLDGEEYEILGQPVRIIQVIRSPATGEQDVFLTVTFRIKKAYCKKDVAVFTLSIGMDVLQLQLPARKILSRFCWWAFKDEDCQYSGPDSDCDRSYEECRKKGNQRRFGGFPGVLTERFFF